MKYLLMLQAAFYIGMAALVVYFIWKRLEEKGKEDFEKRDN